MSLRFLSKKRWHVRRQENIRKVAEAEAKHAEEQTRMAELRREREEERELEAIRRLQEASGQIPTQQPRLEFMFKEPPVPRKTEEDVVTPEEVLKPGNVERNAICVAQKLPGVKWLAEGERRRGDDDMRAREDPVTVILERRRKERMEAEERRMLLERLKAGDDSARKRKKRK